MIRTYVCGRCGKIVQYDDNTVGSYNEQICSCGGCFSERDHISFIRTYECGRCGKIVQYDGYSSGSHNEEQCSCGGHFSEKG